MPKDSYSHAERYSDIYNYLIHIIPLDLVQKAIGAGDDEVLMVIAQKLPDLAEALGNEGEGSSSLIVRRLFL